MDDKVGRRFKLRNRRRQRKDIKTHVQLVTKFLRTHKQSFFAGLLLVVMVVLLFGIFSFFSPPAVSTAPSGETAVGYSAFVEQVEAGNVIGVSIRGNDINALLASPISQGSTGNSGGAINLAPTETGGEVNANSTGLPAAQRNNDLAAWSRYINSNNSSSWSTNSTPPIDPGRIIYTSAPGSGDASLSSLLLSHHVVVSTQAANQSTGWLSMLWRFAPFILVVVILFVMMSSRNSGRGTRGMDDRVSQIGKSRARRFERVQEGKKEGSGMNRGGMKGDAINRVPTGTKGGGMNRAPTSYVAPAGAKARVTIEPQVTFADVAGIDEVRVELEEIVEFLRNPGRYDRLGARIPRGALLVGPPGTGKTLLAKAVAGEAGVPFFSMSASEFVEMFVGVGASRVRDLFNQARQASPCVIFIDEIDAVGRKRSMRVTGNDERDQTLNQLLVELDGFDARKAVVVLAATNRVDILDKALLRPGRFDRHITVSMPDRAGREAILKVHTRNTPLHEDVSLERLARLTMGMTGADLANLVNEAALCAARRDLEQIPHECFEEALIRVQLGALRPIVMSETERRIIAYHEGGHALVAHHLPEADRVNRVTILPRGQSLGVTQFTAEEDRYNYSREFLMTRIAVGLGGRVAEELTFGPERVTTGAENDLQVVTDLARRMVTRWGMSEHVGVMFADTRADGGGLGLNMRQVDLDAVFGRPRSLVADADGHLRLNGDDVPAARYGFAMAAASAGAGSGGSTTLSSLIDSEVQRILNEGRTIARSILAEHEEQLRRLAVELMEREQLDRRQFEAVVKEGQALEAFNSGME